MTEVTSSEKDRRLVNWLDERADWDRGLTLDGVRHPLIPVACLPKDKHHLSYMARRIEEARVSFAPGTREALLLGQGAMSVRWAMQNHGKKPPQARGRNQKKAQEAPQELPETPRGPDRVEVGWALCKLFWAMGRLGGGRPRPLRRRSVYPVSEEHPAEPWEVEA